MGRLGPSVRRAVAQQRQRANWFNSITRDTSSVRVYMVGSLKAWGIWGHNLLLAILHLSWCELAGGLSWDDSASTVVLGLLSFGPRAE
eukprot:4994219-Prymnesium_polylepis.1